MYVPLELMDLDKWDKTAHAKSFIVDTSPKCAEYLFQKDGCSSILIKCCLNKNERDSFQDRENVVLERVRIGELVY